MALDHLPCAWEIHEADDGFLIKVLAHDLDGRTALLLVDELFEMIFGSGRRHLYLDFGEVRHLSSAVLNQLLVLDRTLKDSGGHLALFSLNPCFRDLLQVTHLADLLDVRVIPLPRLEPQGR